MRNFLLVVVIAGVAEAVAGCASRSTVPPVRSNFEVHRVCGVGSESSMDIFVADVQGSLISNQRVSIVSAVAGTDFGGETDASGRIRKPVPAGRYEVLVATERGWAGARQSVAVDAGCAVAVNVALDLAITAVPPQPCFQALGCGTGSCPDYTASVAETRRIGASGGCAIAAVGTCNGLRFTLVGDGFVSQTYYFDGAGKLVAARMGTDLATNASCPGWTHYGRRLTCEEIVTIDYCARERGGDALFNNRNLRHEIDER